MECLLLTLAVAYAVVPIVALVLAIRATAQSREQAARMEELDLDVSKLRRDFAELARAWRVERAAPADVAVEPERTETAEKPPPTPPAEPPTGERAEPPAGETDEPLPSAAWPPSPPPPEVSKPETVRAEPSRPAARVTTPFSEEPDEAGEPDGPDAPEAPDRPSEPPPAGPPIDWERWVGVRGAAVVAGIFLALAGVFFVRYSIEAGWLAPPVRVALGLVAGIAALVGSEPLRRRGYGDASNGLAGGGIVVLYAAVWAARSLYDLIPAALAFGLMILITAVCGLLAWRRASLVVALLGLVGGFATPLLVESETDDPIGLFGYLLLLNAGLLVLGRVRRWPLVPALGLLGTVAYQALWIVGAMEPSQLPLALGVLTLFAALFALALPSERPDDGKPEPLWANTRAAALVLPFLFALYFAVRADLGEHLWPVAAMLLVLSVAAEALGRGLGAGAAERSERQESWPADRLGMGAAVGSLAVVAVWAVGREATAATAWELTGIAVVLALAFHAFAEIDLRRLTDGEAEGSGSELVSAMGMLMVVVGDGLIDPDAHGAARLVGAAALAALLIRQSVLAGAHWRQVVPAVTLGTALPLFHLAHTPDPTLPRVTVLFALTVAGAVVFQLLPLLRKAPKGRHWAELAAVAYPLMALLVMPGATLVDGIDPWLDCGTPLALAVLATLAATRLHEPPRGGWIFGAMGLAAICHLSWSVSLVHADGAPPDRLDLLVGLVAGALAVGFFTAWPFLARPRLDSERWAWYAAALAGPAWFMALRELWIERWGDGAIGLLPVVLAVLSLAAVARVRGRWTGDDPRRLRGLVWFSAVALGFAALAIPLQLDREWVTIGWALEGAGAIALWRRLDHPGLKAFGLGLLWTATVRVLLEAGTAPGAGWLAYTHLVPAASLVGAALMLAPLEVGRLGPSERRQYGTDRPLGAIISAVAAIGIGFVWITRTVDSLFRGVGGGAMAHDLTLSLAWAVYALLLLGLGFARTSRGLRGIGLGLLTLTVVKVFLFDLSGLEDLYRVASLVGLALSLLAVSLAYQRFVFRRSSGSRSESGAGRPDDEPEGPR